MPRKSAHVVASDAETDTLQTVTASKYAHLSETDKHLALVMAADHHTQTEIAHVLGCSQSSVSDFLRRVSNPAKIVQQVLKSHELKAAEHWANAASVAAKRGDHRPARELIEAANPELRPQSGNTQGGGVIINIGMPGQPLEPPSIVIQPTFAPALSPATDTSDDGK